VTTNSLATRRRFEAAVAVPAEASGSPPDRRTDIERIAAVVLVGGVLVALLLRFFIDGHSINRDVAMYFNSGQLILDGKFPYVDFVDVNPPLIMYINVVPAAIARLVPGSAVVVCNQFVWLVVACSTVASHFILRLRRNRTFRSEATLLFAWVATQAYIASSGAWGEREQLFVAAYLPFFLLRSLDGDRTRVPRTMRAALGVVAGTFALLKPGFLLLALVPEVYWALRRGARHLMSIETAFFVGAGAVYAVHFLLLPASIRHAFFDRWLPLVSAHYDATYAVRDWHMLVFRDWVVLLVPFVLAAAGAFAFRRWLRPPPLADVVIPFLLVSGTALAYFWQQQKAWPYQVIPFQVFATMAFAAAASGVWDDVAAWMQRRDRGSWRVVVAVSVSVIVITTISVRQIQPALDHRAQPSPTPNEQLIRTLSPPGGRVVVIATSVGVAYPALVQLGRQPGSRFLWDFPIALYESERSQSNLYPTPDDMTADERQFIDDLEDDITTNRPDLILVQRVFCQGCPPGFDLDTYIERTGIKRDAMTAYTHLGRRGIYDVYVPTSAAN
jgi:hypothetical protein